MSLLTSHQVRFVLVGGHAVAIHGYPRYTADLDLFVEPTPDNARRLRAALLEFGLGRATPDEVSLATAGKVFMIGRLPMRVDLLTRISGVEFDEAWNAREIVETSAGPTAVLSAPHLIANKRAAGRPKDLADVAALEEVARLAGNDTRPRRKAKKHR